MLILSRGLVSDNSALALLSWLIGPGVYRHLMSLAKIEVVVPFSIAVLV